MIVTSDQTQHPPAALPCPPWCTTDHAKTDRFERYVDPIMDLRTHSMDVARIPNPGGNLAGEVVVDVAVTDDLTGGTREGPLVSAHGAECMTPTTATEIAAAITEAVKLAASGETAPDSEQPVDPISAETAELIETINRQLTAGKTLAAMVATILADRGNPDEFWADNNLLDRLDSAYASYRFLIDEVTV